MLEVLEPELNDLLGYWDRMRGDKQMPARADIDPLNIPRLLPHLALIETAESLGDFKYRLYGTEVCEGFGHDRTGARLGDLQEDVDNYEEVYSGYWRVYADKAPDYFYGKIVSLAKNFKRYSRLLLPLSSDDEHVDIILCGFLFFAKELDRGVRETTKFQPRYTKSERS